MILFFLTNCGPTGFRISPLLENRLAETNINLTNIPSIQERVWWRMLSHMYVLVNRFQGSFKSESHLWSLDYLQLLCHIFFHVDSFHHHDTMIMTTVNKKQRQFKLFHSKSALVGPVYLARLTIVGA